MKKILGILIAGFIGYAVYPLFVGSGKMETFCASVLIGELTENLLAQAAESGYSSREVEKPGRILIIDSKAMGRHICEVTISNSKVTGAKYIYNG